MPKVRIVADYCSPGYQFADGDARACGELPVSAELLDRLARWNDGYERCNPGDYEDVCGMRFDFVAFAAEGLEIAKAVKRALPGWTVFYWDESLDWFLAREPRRYDPACSEYEVTLEDATAAVSAERRRLETVLTRPRCSPAGGSGISRPVSSQSYGPGAR